MTTRASYGMTIKIQDEENQKEEIYFLVRAEEENWPERKISMYHPLGKYLFSKEAGDVVSLPQKDGKNKRIKILEIEPT